MASSFEKKSEQIAVKLSPSTLEVLTKVCEAEGRPMGFVVRELAMRGLSQYVQDGVLSPMREAIKEGLRRAIPDSHGQTKEAEREPFVNQAKRHFNNDNHRTPPKNPENS